MSASSTFAAIRLTSSGELPPHAVLCARPRNKRPMSRTDDNQGRRFAEEKLTSHREPDRKRESPARAVFVIDLWSASGARTRRWA